MVLQRVYIWWLVNHRFIYGYDAKGTVKKKLLQMISIENANPIDEAIFFEGDECQWFLFKGALLRLAVY